MKNILLLTLAVLLQSCFSSRTANDFQGLVGKWKAKQYGHEYIVQITKDSLFRVYSYDQYNPFQYKITDASAEEINLVIAPEVQKEAVIDETASKESYPRTGFGVVKEEFAVPEFQKFKYELHSEKLIIIDEKTNMRVETTSCKSGICDEQKDFFKEAGVDVDLPYLNQAKGLSNEVNPNDSHFKIYVGQPKKMHSDIYGGEPQIWNFGKLIRSGDLPLQAEKWKIKSNIEGDNFHTICFIDQTVRMKTIQTLFNQLKSQNIKETYLAIRKTEDVILQFDPALIKMNLTEVEIEDLDTNFGEWIKVQ